LTAESLADPAAAACFCVAARSGASSSMSSSTTIDLCCLSCASTVPETLRRIRKLPIQKSRFASPTPCNLASPGSSIMHATTSSDFMFRSPTVRCPMKSKFCSSAAIVNFRSSH
jgi:hypothetical protein